MGRPKESLPFGDGTMLQRIAVTLCQCARPVTVVRRDDDQLLPALPDEIHVISDEPPSRGPLAAIATGLDHVRDTLCFCDTDAVFVTGCDSPLLSTEAVHWLASQLGEHQLVMPAPDGILQPLCAVYRVAVSRVAVDLLAAGTQSLRSLATATNARLLDTTELQAHDPELRFLRNVNTPSEYDRARDDADT